MEWSGVGVVEQSDRLSTRGGGGFSSSGGGAAEPKVVRRKSLRNSLRGCRPSLRSLIQGPLRAKIKAISVFGSLASSSSSSKELAPPPLPIAPPEIDRVPTEFLHEDKFPETDDSDRESESTARSERLSSISIGVTGRAVRSDTDGSLRSEASEMRRGGGSVARA